MHPEQPWEAALTAACLRLKQIVPCVMGYDAFFSPWKTTIFLCFEYVLKEVHPPSTGFKMLVKCRGRKQFSFLISTPSFTLLFPLIH